MPKHLCRCLGCPAVTSTGDYCWPCWAQRRDKRDCRHTLDALARLNRGSGNLSAYNRVGRSDPGWG